MPPLTALRRVVALLVLAASHALPNAGVAQETQQPPPLTMNPTQLFEFAEQAARIDDYETAETAYRALAENPDLELRTEARFRLALMLADRLGKHREAAVLLRQILDEKPDASRVRIELARMQAAMGNFTAAERELRAAQAAGLPPAVEQTVRFYAAALNAQRPYGFNLELALAPDSNINRATHSDTLGTIIGDFDLGEDAQAHSGVGLSTRGQVWGKLGIAEGADLLTRASGSADFYEKSTFDDYSVSLELGPQLRSGVDRLSLSAVTSWRWFGQQLYTFSWGANATFQHPLGKQAQLRIEGSAVRSDDKLNNLRDANRFALAVGIDRAFSARFGGGFRAIAQREAARDPAYSTGSGGVTGYVFREFRQTTVVLSGGYNHLEADRRLFLYPKRRIEDRITAGLSGTFRALRVGSFAPVVRIQYERNFSTVEIYDYRRIAADFGITGAF